MATTQVETVSTGADKAKVGAAIALVIAALVGFYVLGKQGQAAQWGALLVGLVAAVAIFFTSESGKQFIAFGRDDHRPRAPAHREERLLRDPQPVQGQGLARALRGAHAQAADRHPLADAEDRRLADAARPARRRRYRNQIVTCGHVI